MAHIALYAPLTRLARFAALPMPRIAASYAVFLAGMSVLIPAAAWYANLRRAHSRSIWLP